MRLAGMAALVTGATGGIGREIAARFAAEGARLVLTGRRADPGPIPNGARYVAGDLLDEAFVAALVGGTLAELGRLDILVNGHGRQFDSQIPATNVEDARAVIETNLLAPILTMKHAIPPMVAAGSGSIVNIASRLGIVGIADQAIYSASKGGLIMLTKGAAIDLAASNVRVNAVAPGLTLTETIEASFRRRPDPDAYRKLRESTIPMRRLATPADVAAAVLFLASPESSYITGTVLPVDGGYTAA